MMRPCYLSTLEVDRDTLKIMQFHQCDDDAHLSLTRQVLQPQEREQDVGHVLHIFESRQFSSVRLKSNHQLCGGVRKRFVPVRTANTNDPLSSTHCQLQLLPSEVFC